MVGRIWKIWITYSGDFYENFLNGFTSDNISDTSSEEKLHIDKD